jgi:hypothetical protein
VLVDGRWKWKIGNIMVHSTYGTILVSSTVKCGKMAGRSMSNVTFG